MDYIEKVRLEKGITVTELCNGIGTQRTTYYKWLKGERTPKIDKIIKMCEVLGIDFTNNVEKFL